MDSLGEALRLIRVFHDYTTTELSKELDISSSFISDIERSKKKPSMDLIGKYASVFKTTPASILLFSEELESKSKMKNGFRKKAIELMQILEKYGKN